MAIAGALILGYLAGAFRERRRVLRYLDRHLDRDADWLRCGIDADEHH